MAPIAIQELKYDHVEPDPRNPRQVCEEALLTELANDIAVRGILQPIVVRPHPDKKGRFMIVFGERRWRAAGMVDCDTVPAIVREYAGELQVLEDQIAENGKRADVHPLEEADAYRRLHEEHGRDVEEIADLTGKSKAYVYAAMKLCALTGEARKAFLGNSFDKSVALIIARLPEDLQPKATKQILHGRYNDGVMSYREARDYVQREFMLELGRAPFNINDATLVADAGTCGECPKRTGNQQELFGDVCSEKGGHERCTDPACFKAKSDAHWKRAKEQFKAAGKEVLEGEAGNRAGSYNDKKYVELDSYCHDVGKSYKQILGRKGSEAVAAIAKTDSGVVRELVERKRLPELLKAAGVKAPRSLTGPTPKEKEKRKEEKREQALEAAVVARVHQEVLTKATVAGEGIAFWRLLARMTIRAKGGYGVTTTLDQVLARRKGTLLEVLAGDKADAVEEGSSDERLFRWIDETQTVAELRALVFELLLGPVGDDIYTVKPDEHAPKKSDESYDGYRAQEQSDLLDAIDVFGVDVKALTKEATKAFEAAELAKAEAKKAPKHKPQDGELAIPHKPGCELERFVFTAAGAGVEYHPRKGGPTSTGAGGFSERKCPRCDSGVTTPALAAKPKKAANGVKPAAEATP